MHQRKEVDDAESEPFLAQSAEEAPTRRKNYRFKSLRRLRNSNNLRFKEIYQPPEPIVLIIFFTMATIIWVSIKGFPEF
jgi:hypothetical protein